jgi:hydrogenase maturation protease
MKQILIAGIGNIFLGDDGFGCEVIRELASRSTPPEWTIKDFGSRSYDLAYALTKNFDTIILVDATQRGDAPGTLYHMEIDLGSLTQSEPPVTDAHAMNPVVALQMAKSVGEITAKIYLVGCEPAIVESEDGQFGFSDPVQQAIPQAVAMIEQLARQELGERKTNNVEVIA